MIPSMTTQSLKVIQQPSLTYGLVVTDGRVRGELDGVLAMEQFIYKVLNTERYQYLIYSWNFGVELLDLIGQPLEYVIPELERRITDALTVDQRILSVGDFSYDAVRGAVIVRFRVNTVFGSLAGEKVVNY